MNQLILDAFLTERAERIRTLGKRVVNDVIEIGKLLIECKVRCGHGNWLPWLEREFGWTDKTAERYISVYQLSVGKFDTVSNLDLPMRALYLLAAPSTPESARDEVIELAESGKRISHAEVQAIIDAHSPAAVLRAARTIHREQKAERQAQRREELTAQQTDLPSSATIFNCDFNDAPIAHESIDWIITDPPYGKDAVALYGQLAHKAAEWLRPGGSLLVLTGQYHLPDILDQLRTAAGLRWHWEITYHLAGQAAQNFARRINCIFFKPILWFTKGDYDGRWVTDVVRSERPDKRFHDWGQSESGFADLIDRYTKPGEVICDPFMCAGTTGVVALRLGRRFVGVEINAQTFADARARLSTVEAEPPEYDADADFSGSINEAYAAIRQRVANGGPPWVPS
jgi:site-specific DNA-methyltransferase (adenine-specific)